MIGMTLGEIIGGEPVTEADIPVFHVHERGNKGKVLEKVVASDAKDALAKAGELLGDVPGMYVTGPHEMVAMPKNGGVEKE